MSHLPDFISIVNDFRSIISDEMIEIIKKWLKYRSNIASNDIVDTMYNLIITSNKLRNPWSGDREIFIRYVIYNISSNIEEIIFSTVRNDENEKSLSNGIILVIIYEILLSIIVGLGHIIRMNENIDKKNMSKIIKRAINLHNEHLKISTHKMFRKKRLDKDMFPMIRQHIVTLNNIFDALDFS